MTHTLFLSLIISLSIAITGCNPKQPSPVNVDREIELLSDLNVAETEMDEAISLGISLYIRTKSQIETAKDTNFKLDNCANVALLAEDKKLVLDFGPEGCLNPNGRLQQGRLTFSFNKTWFQPGAVVHISFQQYEVKRKGSNTFVRMDNNSSIRIENQSITDSLIDFKRVLSARLNFVDGSALTWQSTRNVKWNVGPNPEERFAHSWTVSTNAICTGQSRIGLPFQASITTPLKFSGPCLQAGGYSPVAGSLKATSTDIVRIADFGQGACGDKADVSINGVARQIYWP